MNILFRAIRIRDLPSSR